MESNNLLQFELEDSIEPQRRPVCAACLRPSRVCWCPSLPKKPLSVATHILLLQHPNEENRKIRTARIVELCLEPDKVTVLRGRNFNEKTCTSSAWQRLSSPHSRLLYPTDDAQSLSSASQQDKSAIHCLVVIDGTWAEAKGIYLRNSILQSMKKVCVRVEQASEFVVRTQPFANCVSTVEAVGRALADLEGREDVLPVLTQPLQTLCRTQLLHGAVPHDSRQSKCSMSRP